MVGLRHEAQGTAGEAQQVGRKNPDLCGEIVTKEADGNHYESYVGKALIRTVGLRPSQSAGQAGVDLLIGNALIYTVGLRLLDRIDADVGAGSRRKSPGLYGGIATSSWRSLPVLSPLLSEEP